MTEEQFWESNPTIIEVWRESYQIEQENKNRLAFGIIGSYGISALTYSIDHVLNGRKAHSKYYEKPIDLFEPSKKELERREQEKVEDSRNQLLDWCNQMKKNFKKRKEGEIKDARD